MDTISMKAFSDEMQKISKELTTEAREHIAPKNFALSAKQSDTDKPAYPIHDRRHAANALSRVGQFGSPKEKAEVYKDVAKKYPDLARKSDVPAVKAKVKEAASWQKTSPYFWGHSLLNPLPGSGYGAAAGGLMTEPGQEHAGLRGAGLGALMGGGAYGLKGLTNFERLGRDPRAVAALAALGALGGATGGAHAAHAVSQEAPKKKSK